MLRPLFSIFILVFTTFSLLAGDFRYTKTDNSGLGKQERLDAIEGFLATLDSKLTKMQKAQSGDVEKRVKELNRSLDQVENQLRQLTRQLKMLTDQTKVRHETEKAAQTTLDELKTRVEYLESKAVRPVTE